MQTLTNLLSSSWVTLLGLGSVITLVALAAVLWLVFPAAQPFLTKLSQSLGDWLEYNLALELNGWKVISNSAAALIFLITAMFGVHVADKYYFLKQTKEEICKAMLQDLRENYIFQNRPKPKSKGWFK